MATLVRRSNGIFYLVFTIDGKRVWQSTGCKTKSDALSWLAERHEANAPTNISLRKFRTKFLDYAASNLAPKTVDLYRQAFDRFLEINGNKSLSAYNAQHIEKFKTKRLETVSPVKANIDFRTLRAAFNVAVNWELLESNPFHKVKQVRIVPKKPVYFTQDEFRALISIIPDECVWFRDLVQFAVSTMMRLGEIVNLRWTSVDVERRLITIENTSDFNVKTHKARTIPMDDWVFSLLSEKKRLGERVFTFPNGRYLKIGYVSARFKKYVRKAGLSEEFHFHVLRHTGATWLVQADVPIYTVQQLLGHSRVDMTQIYSHLDVEHLRKPLEKIRGSLNQPKN